MLFKSSYKIPLKGLLVYSTQRNTCLTDQLFHTTQKSLKLLPGTLFHYNTIKEKNSGAQIPNLFQTVMQSLFGHLKNNIKH